MSDSRTFRLHARMLLRQAANERDPRRQRYLAGLASSYEALAERQDEPKPPEQPKPPAMAPADRAAVLATALRRRGYRASGTFVPPAKVAIS
jgi:hypothetical protein